MYLPNCWRPKPSGNQLKLSVRRSMRRFQSSLISVYNGGQSDLLGFTP